MSRLSLYKLACLSAGLATLVATAGCAPRQPNDGRVHLKVWSMWSGDEEKAFEAVLAMYHKEHPDIVIDNLGAVTDEKSTRAIIAGAPPDIFTLIDPTSLSTLAANNALVPLDERFNAAGFNDAQFTPGALDQCRYHGRLYGMPYLLDCVTLMYNKTVMADAGLDPNRPPQTWEELEADCKTVTKRDSEGKLTRIGLRPTDIQPIIITMFDGKFLDGNRVTADNPNNVEALAAYMHLMDQQGGYQDVQAFASGFGANTTSFNPFFHGDVAFYVSGEWNPHLIWQQSPSTQYGVTALPYPTDHPDRKGSVWLADNIFAIPRGAKRSKEAWDFLKWIQSPEAQYMFASKLNNVPNLRSELTAPRLTTDPPYTPKSKDDRDPNSWRPEFGQFLALADSPTATSFPSMPVASMYVNEIGNAFDQVGYGRKTPKQALAGINKRIQKEMDKCQ